MLLLTQNCSWLPIKQRAERLQAICKKIQELRPDVVFLQEIILNTYLKNIDLQEYEMFYEKGRLWIQGGLVILVRKDLGPVEFVRFHRYKSQGRFGSRQIAGRLIKYGFLEVYLKNRNLSLVNTHLIPTFKTKFVEDKAQTRQLYELLEHMAHGNPLILGGDFNFPQGSSFYELVAEQFQDYTCKISSTFKRYAGFLVRDDIFMAIRGRLRLRRKQQNTQTATQVDAENRHIDFIFGRNLNVRVLKQDVIEHATLPNGKKVAPISDHHGVLVKLSGI